MIKKISLIFIFTTAICTSAFALSDAQIKEKIIAESIRNYRAYSGNCPCPYNSDRAGRSCGKRSAYSRDGGESPLCYPQDVTKAMVENYKKNH